MPPASSNPVVDRLRGTIRELVALLGTASEATLRRVVIDGEWAPATVVAHLADAELVYAVRLRRILTEDRPYLPAYDEKGWARRLFETEVDTRETLQRFRVVREATLRVLDSLEPEEWSLPAVHAERGELTLTKVAELMASHDREHLAQIRTALAGRT